MAASTTASMRSAIHAVCSEDLKVLRRLIREDGFDINARRDGDGQTLLHIAAAHLGGGTTNGYDVMGILLEISNLDVHVTDNKGRTPLDVLFEVGLGQDHRAVYSMINDHNAYTKHPIPGQSVHFSISFRYGIDVIQFMVDRKADLGWISNGNGNSVLHEAVRVDATPEVLQYLIDHKASINARNKNGETPLHYALRFRSTLETVQLLLSHNADINATDHRGCTPLHATVSRKRRVATALPSMVLSYSPYLKLVPNHNASAVTNNGGSCNRRAKAPVMELLLSHAVDVCARDDKGQTPLHDLVESDSIGAVTLFLEHLRLNYSADTMESVLAVANHVQQEAYLPFHYVRSRKMAKLLLEQPTFEDDEVVLRVCYYMLFAKDAAGSTLHDLQSSNKTLRRYLSSYTDLPVAVVETSASKGDEQRTRQPYELAVRTNPRLNDFQCTVVTAFVQKWKGWEALFQPDGCAEFDTLDQEGNHLLLPDEVKYGIMGYLTPADLMKAAHSSNRPAVREEDTRNTADAPQEEGRNKIPPDASRTVSQIVARALCSCWRR